MSDEVSKYDYHRLDDVFYAYTVLFMKRSFTDVSWTNDVHETNFHRASAFPIELVRPYMERLLQMHGTGPLLHTIIAANFECEPIPTNGKPLALVVNNTLHTHRLISDVMGLAAACGLDLVKMSSSQYECIRCKSSIQTPITSMLSVYQLLRLHAAECNMSSDDRYVRPMTDFWNDMDRDAYVNFLHKSVAETVLTKLGLLIVCPKRLDELPYSAFMRNRRLSLRLMLQSRKPTRYNEETLDRMVQAGYHMFPSSKAAIGWHDLKKTFKDSTSHATNGSKITCFSCHHVVRLNSEFLNDPWKYHAKRSPLCRFLLMKKGIDYVRQVQDSMHNIRSRLFLMKDRSEAVIEPGLDLKPPTTPIGQFFNLCKNVYPEKQTGFRVALSTTTVSECIVCSSEMRTVALMSCLHIVTCVDCSFAIRSCPLCRTMISGFMMPVYHHDGSFWKQIRCVGGNYFINLPCRHLIESCVPNNVSKCPSAYAVEEDNIYCIVCGNPNLGKLRVYL